MLAGPALGAMAAVLALGACSSFMPTDTGHTPSPAAPPSTLAVSSPLEPTPVCYSAQPTPAQTEGPYFKPGSPQRSSLLEPGISGVRLVVAGQVLTRDCQPVAGARLDFWQADAQGEYDNAGYRLRGHQFSVGGGGYRLETVVPGEYPGRPPHIHVKVTPPNAPTLTTQLYFSGLSGRAAGDLFDPRLVLSAEQTAEGKSARFNFVP